MSLNDPQWGRKSDDQSRDDKNTDAGADTNRDSDQNGAAPRDENRDSGNRDDRNQNRGNDRNRDSADGDLDALWDDFNRALGGLMGGNSKRPTNNGLSNRDNDNNGNGGNNGNSGGNDNREYRPRPSFPVKPPVNAARSAVGALAVALIAWAASGIYIVPEGQIGVVTTFGRYTQDSAAGINWHMPWPVQDVELVDVSSVRKAEIGMRGSNSRLREALMLTDDENIVDVQFNVQYRIKPHAAKDYLFHTRNPDKSVFQAAESAMREVVGRKKMDSVLFESKQEIAQNVLTAMQTMLDRYETGIEVMSVAIQNAQPPEQVQAAFNDAVKAGQDRERQINEGQAYANAVVPKARGMASRLVQEAEGYKARVEETATGDTERFSQVLAQYEKAPRVTRDRLYIDAMAEIYASTKKVLVQGKSGTNLLYLPIDKLMAQTREDSAAQNTSAAASAAVNAANSSSVTTQSAPTDDDPRAMLRSRGR